jgi:hypothetical protein
MLKVFATLSSTMTVSGLKTQFQHIFSHLLFRTSSVS